MNSNKPLRYWLEIEGATFPLRELRGQEGLSRVSRFELALNTGDPLFADPDDLLRRDAQIHLEKEGGARVRSVAGLITEASIDAVITGAPEVRLTVEPRLSLARHREDNRVFRDRTVPQMVVEVLAAIGVAPELRLRQSYAERPYTVQQKESDLDFVSRLLEDEGIFYFLNDGDQLVLGDSAAAYEPIEGDRVIPFRVAGGLDTPEETVHSAGERAELAAGRVTLRDFRADHPSLDMDVDARVPKLHDDQPEGPEYYEYPGGYTDPAVGNELARLRQEAQHSAAHMSHFRALVRRWPGLQDTMDEVIASYDRLTATKPLAWRLAYTAIIENTFTPYFKVFLDHEDKLFEPGDDRVASLFLWHFVEEVEHRSSALVIYDAIVDDPWYRMRMVPSIFKHVWAVLQTACDGFNTHVPLAERKIDAVSMFGMQARKKALLQRLPFTTAPDDGPFANAFSHLPKREMLTALSGVVRSQIPGHNPAHENLPELAGEWFDRYNDGADCTLWYTAAGRRTPRNEAVGVPHSGEAAANV